jgi:hypothetical protein
VQEEGSGGATGWYSELHVSYSQMVNE